LASRNAADIMIGRMLEDGAIERIKRGLYGLIGTKARMEEAAAAKAKGRRSFSSFSQKDTETDHLTP
jgi:hypothetical protein